ncbi:serine hydrolase domain-containing protein [Flavobacterium sp. U410]
MRHFLKLVFVFFFCISSNLFAQEKDDYSISIDNLLKEKSPYSFNGVILVTKKGKIKYSKSYGFTNFDKKKPLTLDHNFEIMSNSKQFTSVLLLKEVEKGNVNLQSPIKNYLPYVTQTWADTVTVHQLLNHTHGIVDIEKPLVFKAGSDFKYGNLSNILLGKIIEFSSKKTYTELAKELFKELNMKHTFCYSKTTIKNLVSGHLIDKNNYKVVDSTFINTENIPADGIITTAEDLFIWNENLHKGKILKPETYQLMTTESAKSQHNVFGKEKMGYGYNIRIVDDNGIQYFGHTGLGDGFSSLNIYVPQYDISIIVLENQMSEDSDLYYYYERKIKDIILKSNLVK